MDGGKIDKMDDHYNKVRSQKQRNIEQINKE